MTVSCTKGARRLHVLYSFPGLLGRPGIGTTALHHVMGLVGTGARVTLYCGSTAVPLPASLPVVETLRVRGRRVPHRALGVDNAYALHDFLVARALQSTPALHDVDVVHTWPLGAARTLAVAADRGVAGLRELPNTHTANAYAQAAEEARVTGIPAERGYSHRFSARRLRLEELEYARAGALLAPSDAVLASFVARGVSAERLRRTQYGHDPERFHTVGRVEVPDRPFTAVFAGGSEPRKGLHYVLEAWASAGLPEGCRLLICGRVSPTAERALRTSLHRPGVELLDFVDDLAPVLRRSDVLLLPSVEEGSALVTYEAQACGCIPLVSSAVGAPLVDGRQGLVHAPRDTSALAAHLRAVHDDVDLRGRLRSGAMAQAPELTWAHGSERLLQVYRELCTGGRTRRGDQADEHVG